MRLKSVSPIAGTATQSLALQKIKLLQMQTNAALHPQI